MIGVNSFHHIAIAVRNLKEAKAFYQDVMGAQLVSEDYLEAEQRNAAFLDLGGVLIELMEPTSSDGALAKFIERHGEGVHSVGLKVNNLAEAASRLEEKGVRIVGRQAAPPYAFTHPKDTFGTMIEISE